MVLAIIVLFVMAIGGIRILAFISEDDDFVWRESRIYKRVLLGFPILLALTIWYRIDSNDLWAARADLHDGIEYFVDAPEGPEIISVDSDRIPTIWWPNRPQRRRNSCAPHRFFGDAEIFTSAIDDIDQHFDRFEQFLQDDGWETVREINDLRPLIISKAFRGDKSVSILWSRTGNPDTDRFILTTNENCREDLIQG